MKSCIIKYRSVGASDQSDSADEAPDPNSIVGYAYTPFYSEEEYERCGVTLLYKLTVYSTTTIYYLEGLSVKRSRKLMWKRKLSAKNSTIMCLSFQTNSRTESCGSSTLP